MRPKADIEQIIDTYGDTVWRVCVLHFGQRPDAQDAFQEAMLKYSLGDMVFNEEEHCKAWLIRVTTNVCKDMLKAACQKNISIDVDLARYVTAVDEPESYPDSDFREALDAIRNLADPPRTPVYLALYEGYTALEISNLLDAPVNTVYSWIARGKQQLREVLG